MIAGERGRELFFRMRAAHADDAHLESERARLERTPDHAHTDVPERLTGELLDPAPLVGGAIPYALRLGPDEVGNAARVREDERERVLGHLRTVHATRVRDEEPLRDSLEQCRCQRGIDSRIPEGHPAKSLCARKQRVDGPARDEDLCVGDRLPRILDRFAGHGGGIGNARGRLRGGIEVDHFADSRARNRPRNDASSRSLTNTSATASLSSSAS